jgi:hypothetical protein
MTRLSPKLEPVGAGNPWERQLLLSSIPLKRLSAENKVEGAASGCLVDYFGKRLILSVFHATGKSAKWAIELEYEHGKGTKLIPITSWNFLGRMSLENLKMDMVDFSYGVISKELNSVHQQYDENQQLLWKAPRTIFKPTFTENPVLGEPYGFSGHTQLEQLPHPTNPNLSVLCATQTVLGDLSYIKTIEDMHYFKLPGKHPGHIYFEGCSGAPIINKHGQPVALVVGGNTDEDTIWGVALKTYKAAIDIEVENIPGLK